MRWSNEREGPREMHTDGQKEIERECIGEKEADRRKCKRANMRESERGRENVK
jgi:hypothetical protein